MLCAPSLPVPSEPWSRRPTHLAMKPLMPRRAWLLRLRAALRLLVGVADAERMLEEDLLAADLRPVGRQTIRHVRILFAFFCRYVGSARESTHTDVQTPSLIVDLYIHISIKTVDNFTHTLICIMRQKCATKLRYTYKCSGLFLFLFFLLERDTQEFKESCTFFFIFSCGNQSNRHAENVADIFISCFRKNSVLFDANGEVADSIHCRAGNTTEIFGAGDGDIYKFF